MEAAAHPALMEAAAHPALRCSFWILWGGWLAGEGVQLDQCGAGHLLVSVNSTCL